MSQPMALDLALPYWTTNPNAGAARWKLAGVVGLTVATTGVSVMFNFLGRDFFNALSEKNADEFTVQLFRYLGGFVIGIPFFVFRSYFQSKLALEWREWTTEQFLKQYLSNRTFYQLQSAGSVDNPDQRVSSDIRGFTDTAINLSLTLLNAVLDLVSFSGILYSIYPPLFAALIAYSITGTVISIALGKNLVTLNFNQEAREADFRYGLVRVRENAEGIAFYQGEEDEGELLKKRLKAAVENYLGLLVASRNLDFFTSFYRYMIQLLPAAVVAPLFFSGKIEFGVINQSQSAFNHVLNDLSLVVYQFESLAGFSAVVDRLGEFQEVMREQQLVSNGAAAATPATLTTATTISSSNESAGALQAPSEDGQLLTDSGGRISLTYSPAGYASNGGPAASVSNGASSNGNGSVRSHPAQDAALLQLTDVEVITPRGGISTLLIQGLTLEVSKGKPLLIMGPSGAGKTSVLRALAGLWSNGGGNINICVTPAQLMFLPQKPYMVLGSLRQQVLYPRCTSDVVPAAAAPVAEVSAASTPATDDAAAPAISAAALATAAQYVRSDAEILHVLNTVQLGHLMGRYAAGTSQDSSSSSSSSSGPSMSALDAVADWAGTLSLGEQQRLAWARLLLARPQLALLDEATSALDQETEAALYKVLSDSGITYVSVGHRPSLRMYHQELLQLKTQTGDNGVGWQLLPLTASGEVLQEEVGSISA
ncbi:MAG: hypothetical protein WDW36_006696 [Sanguina aurantia]